jgi:glycosyltransferase involved in cell wall biosynthesis
VEALLAGMPVVTSALGGPAELVDERCGILLPPGDAAALARALHTLIADGSLRRQMGGEGVRRARELCDPAVQIPRIAQVLERACA